MCIFIWEWIYAKQIALRDTRWALGVFRGSNIKKVWKSFQMAGPIGTKLWFTSAYSSRNGHRLNTSRPTIPQGAFGGGGFRCFRGSQIQMYGEAVKLLDRLAPHLAHMCRFIWGWIYDKQITIRDTRGHLGVLGGQTFKKSGEAVKRLDRLAPTLVHVCGFIWEWT